MTILLHQPVVCPILVRRSAELAALSETHEDERGKVDVEQKISPMARPGMDAASVATHSA